MLQVSKRSKRIFAFLVGFMMIVSQSSYLSLNKVYAETNDSNTTEIVYVLTDTLESGQKYIVSNNDSGSVSILERSGGNITSAGAEVTSDDNGPYIKDPPDGAVWTAVNGDSGTLLVNGDYAIGLDENGNLVLGKKSGENVTSWSFDTGNQQLSASGGDNPVYLVFANGFEASNDGDGLSLFVASEIETGQDEDTEDTRGPPEEEETAAPGEGSTIGAPTNGKTVLVFTSDIHNSSDNKAADRLGTWLDKIASMYTGINAIGFCGDMGSASANESQFWTYTQEVMNVVSQKGISDAVYTTGNHEFYNGKYASTTNPVKDNYKKGEVGATGSNYIIYCLGTDNWNNNSDNYPQSQIDDLISDLNDLGNDKPIIILTHYPLHYFGSSSGYYGMGGRSTVNADLVIDALNDAAADGKKIVLLWGHNHSVSDTHYDKVYGPGDTLDYASGKSKDINFYYAAAGCMSDSEYGNGSAFVKGKGLVITIDSEKKLTFSFYDASGENVTQGGTFTEGTPINATAIALSPKTLKVEAGSSESLTVTFTPSDTTNRRVTWSSSNPSVATVYSGKVTGVAPGTATITASYADGSLEDTCEVTVSKPAGQGVTPENGKKYVILASDGYALTSEDGGDGYTNGSDGNQQFTYNGLAGEKYTVGEDVTPERLLWTFTESEDGSGYYIQSQDGKYLNGTYVSNNHDGYDGTLKLDDTSDVWTISTSTVDSKTVNILKSTNASQSDAGDKYLTHGNGNESEVNIFTLRSEENATSSVFYEYTEDGTYVDDDPGTPDDPTPDDPTPAEGTIYKLTDQFASGKDYLIVSSNKAGSANALTNPGGTSSGAGMGSTDVVIKSGDVDGDGTSDQYISADTAGIVWKASANESRYNLKNSSDYLEGKSGEVKIFSEQQYADRGWTYTGNQLQHEGGNNTYKVYYDGGFKSTYNSTDHKVYLFEKVAEGTVIPFGPDDPDDPTPDDPTPAEGTIYKLADQMTDGRDYLIVNTNHAGSAYALTNPGGDSGGSDMGETSVAIKKGDADGDGASEKYISAEEANIVWTAAANGDGFNITNGTDYLEGKSGKVKIFSEQQYAGRYWTYTDNQLQHVGGQNTYTVYYENGFTSTYNSTSKTIYIFEKVEASIHTHNFGVPTYEWADDFSKVTATRVCAECSETETETVNAVGEVTKPASCEGKGKTTYTSEAFTNDAFEVQTKTVENIDALGHKWGTWEVTKPATCTEKGEMTRTCERCSVTETKELAMVPHTIVIDEAVPATCTKPGKTEGSHCSVCDKTIVEQKGIPALGHKWKHVVNKAGYLKDGVDYYQCTVCGEIMNRHILNGYANYYVKSFKVGKAKKAFTAKWKKQSKANQKKFNGYQIRYSTSPIMSGAKYTTAGKNSTSKKIKGLAKKTKYYVQVRTYTKYGGKNFYSEWSLPKAVKTK